MWEGEGVHEHDSTIQTSYKRWLSAKPGGLFLERPGSFLGLESYFVFCCIYIQNWKMDIGSDWRIHAMISDLKI